MSGDVIGNPEEIMNFAQRLKVFNDLVENNTSQLKGAFNKLGETWKDQEHHKFAAEFEHTMRVIDKFLQISKQHGPFLYRKAKALKEYQDTHR